MRRKIGSVNLAVLPVPVCALPIESQHWEISGMAFACIGAGKSQPLSDTAGTNSGLRPRDKNDMIESFLQKSTRRAQLRQLAAWADFFKRGIEWITVKVAASTE